MPVERCLASSVVPRLRDYEGQVARPRREALVDKHSLPDVAPGFVLPRAQSRPRKRGSAPGGSPITHSTRSTLAQGRPFTFTCHRSRSSLTG